MTFDSLLAVSTLAQADATAPTAAPATGTAATGTGAAGTAATGTQKAEPPSMMLPMMMMAVVGVFIVMSFLNNRKDKKRTAEMMSRLQKGAKVTTTCGARGRIAELSDTEVTIQFEDCRIVFLRAAIQSVDEVPA